MKYNLYLFYIALSYKNRFHLQFLSENLIFFSTTCRFSEAQKTHISLLHFRLVQLVTVTQKIVSPLMRLPRQKFDLVRSKDTFHVTRQAKRQSCRK
jgi:hypothetical protein